MVHLRFKDADFDLHLIVLREAKGNRDRVVMLAAPAKHPGSAA